MGGTTGPGGRAYPPGPTLYGRYDSEARSELVIQRVALVPNHRAAGVTPPPLGLFPPPLVAAGGGGAAIVGLRVLAIAPWGAFLLTRSTANASSSRSACRTRTPMKRCGSGAVKQESRAAA